MTDSPFHLLLERLDADPSVAAERYEELRVKIVHLLRWRGVSDSNSDELADRTLDRVAAKIAEGEEVENVAAFAAGVARFIWLEHSRRNKIEAVGDDLPEVAVEPDLKFLDDGDERMRCLRRCFATGFSDDDRRLVLGYYDTDADEKAKQARKRLAESFGMTMNALKVRACRLRMKLETCINGCVSRVTKSVVAGTQRQEIA